MTDNTKHVIEQIQERYGTIVDRYRSANTPLPVDLDGCVPPATGRDAAANLPLAAQLYGREAVADLPESVTDVALGCGNPTAIAQLKPGETVLDLGSGGGIDCFLAAQAVGPTGYVIGVDVTESMLTLANHNKAKLGLSNVEFRHGQIEALPVESASIDSIISNCVIDISPDKAAVFAEAFRVLKPGGRVSIADTVIQGAVPEALKANIDRWAGAVITPLITLEAYVQCMRQAGFVEVTVESLTSYGLENLEAFDEASRQMLTQGVDWSTLPADAGLYSARIVAKKPVTA
jgi:ubiquinone/menaquinone biosynthesis C-methylase UbiE